MATAMVWPPRLFTSSMFDRTFSYWRPRFARNTTGISSVMSAIGPCFISAADSPSAWMYSFSFSGLAPVDQPPQISFTFPRPLAYTGWLPNPTQ
ncbi:hypothetical protein ES708_29461 [subsurface metagenome]